MCLSATKCFAPTELGSWSRSYFYKPLVPLGPKISATNNTNWFVTRTLELGILR